MPRLVLAPFASRCHSQPQAKNLSALQLGSRPDRTTAAGCLIALMLLVGCQPITPVPPAPVATVIAADAPRILTSLASPDGQWRAEVTAYACTPTGEGEMAYEQLTLTNTTTGEETIAATQIIACGGLGAYGLAGRRRWSGSPTAAISTSPPGVKACPTAAASGYGPSRGSM